MASENSLTASWLDRISVVLIAALLGFLFTQLWSLQSTLSVTALKLGELTVYSNETLINTRQLIQQGTLVAQATDREVAELKIRIRVLEDFVTAHGVTTRQDYDLMLERLKRLEGTKRKK